jgi:hypothetical protein
MTFRKKLIEVALPLEAINVASARKIHLRSDLGMMKRLKLKP